MEEEERYIEVYEDDEYFEQVKKEKKMKIIIYSMLSLTVIFAIIISLYFVSEPVQLPSDNIVRQNDFESIEIEDYYPTP